MGGGVCDTMCVEKEKKAPKCFNDNRAENRIQCFGLMAFVRYTALCPGHLQTSLSTTVMPKTPGDVLEVCFNGKHE